MCKNATMNLLKRRMQTEEIGCKELSERTGISVTSLYRKLRGESLFNIEEAGRICRALRIPPEEIAVFFTAFSVIIKFILLKEKSYTQNS